ncbi:hypothetical protein POK33_29510 [Burkholderia cenocepacia]|uniref:hypothetical protein n=1 Tax=Burkholderia cenocepacia TaxID=95486 RepID=UPI0023B8AECE|nr:hypothetical protein [Burkholderia cenocepacia]MDF0504877.1 hypothetical protein [Burkholderia cenocepacia]
MNVSILEAEWGPTRNGYLTYQVKALIGSVRSGEVLLSSRCVHEMTYQQYRRQIEEDVHATVSKSFMERLLEDLRR